MAAGLTTEVPEKGKHMTGEQRETFGKQMRARYEQGASIRELAEESGRSFGFVNTVLREAGATIRSRGGANRKV